LLLPTLSTATAANGNGNTHATDDGDGDGDDETTVVCCGFCHEPPSYPVHAQCSHVFCETCVTDYLQLLEQDNKGGELSTSGGSGKDDNLSCAVCPLCMQPLSLVFNKKTPSSTEEEGNFPPTSSTSYLSSGSERARGRGRKNFINKLDLSNFQSSTKLEALMQELHAMRQRDLGAKAIVFSQFVNMLDVSYNYFTLINQVDYALYYK
jgi:DNA repair protein RAD16